MISLDIPSWPGWPTNMTISGRKAWLSTLSEVGIVRNGKESKFSLLFSSALKNSIRKLCGTQLDTCETEKKDFHDFENLKLYFSRYNGHWTIPTVLNPFEQVEVRILHSIILQLIHEAFIGGSSKILWPLSYNTFASNTGLRLHYLSFSWSSLASLILAEFEKEEQYWMFTRPLRQIYWIPACLKGKFLRNKLQILYDFRDKYITLKL